ncbi:glycosyl hydrolases family 31-domain-containing protein [Podospora appendiculata]|uniref:alpha-glucosidase n=1 Tax=Podospora appendiculata TaxID=314037 RepID=A0AAE0XAI6_9PEZI|nr:glycosyl hydrolases family 31-domain-containing protein [Podospora appendiculata]
MSLSLHVLTLLAVLGTTAVQVLAAPLAQCAGYQATNVLQGDSYLVADLALASNCSLYSQDIPNLRLLVEYQTETRLHVLIEDADRNVFQVQERVLPRPSNQNVSAASAALRFNLVKSPFSFQVTRASTGEVLFDTSAAPLIFEWQYVRLRTRLPKNANLYGLGEHSDDFRLPTTNYRRTFWNAESPFIPPGQNLYGSHPVYFDHRGQAGTHGVFLLSASGMDININQTDAGDQYLEYNTIGGVLDFYFLAGPEPAAVSKQYAQVVGLPAMVPYWTLGFQQCKYGWPNVEHVAQVVANYSAAAIPLEVLWGDIDYMNAHEDFSVDPTNFPLPKMQSLVASLHANSQRYVVILDPGIHYRPDYATFQRGAQHSAFLKAADGSWYRGLQWAGEVVWPDWLAAGTQDWWTDEILAFFNNSTTGLDVDGLWTDMDEASNMCGDTTCLNGSPNPAQSPPSNPGPLKGLPDRDLFHPSYRIANHRGDISASTLYTNITNADLTSQYDTHNLYGTMMASATYTALLARRPGIRPFVLTRSTFAGTGRRAAHWFGDNASTWADYRATIRQLLAFASMHAMPMVGSDVCGFNGAAQEHMCARWAALGAFQPFFRNHADISAPSQELYRWPVVAAAARKSIDARYRLLDYLYTAMRCAARDGSPSAKPLWFVYPGDVDTYAVQTQWMLGDALLVSPVVDDDAQSVRLYLPDDLWYDFWTWEAVRGTGGSVTVDGVPWTDIPVHIRGGSIVPMRVRSANTTALVRRENFTVVVAPGVDGTARGVLYLDDGESVDVGDAWSEIGFSWDGARFDAGGVFGYRTDVVVESVVVLGGSGGPRTKTGPWGLGGEFGFVF